MNNPLLQVPIVEDPASAVLPLSGLILNASDTIYPDRNAVVEYLGSLSSSMTMRGVEDSSSKYVAFRSGVMAGPGNLDAPDEDDQRVDTSMPIVQEVRQAVADMGRRSSAMPVTWHRMDLFGVVRRLAMGCTAYSKWGVLSAVNLRGGGNANVASIASVIEPIAADAGAVFISAKIVGHSRPNIMAAFIGAVSGERGTVYTDLLGIDAAGVLQVPNAANAALAQGCHDALRILGAMFRACNMGAFYALAVTEGVHRITSLHAHSDEGGYVRDVFRALHSGVPYGAIIVDIDPDNAMPSPQRSVAGFRAVYDAIAIATAGAVALADPMVNYHGRDFPTVLVTDQGGYVDPGEDNAGDAADAADLSTQWAEACGAWARNYAKALNLIFVTSGGLEEVERHLVTQANSLAGQDNRHLRMKVAVAFCWVEPTCSCPVGDDSFPAFVANHGPLALSSGERVIPSLDGCTLLAGRSDHMVSSIQVDFRYPRRHGMLVHLGQHARNGLGNIQLSTGVVNDFLLVGGQGDLGARILAHDSLDTYLWGRGQSTILAPGELISLSQTNVLTVNHVRHAADVVRNSHTPTGSECVYGEVVLLASKLYGSAPAAPGAVTPSAVRRARSRAAVSLSLAADSGRTEYVIAAQTMRPSLVDFGPLPPDGRNTALVREADQGVVRPGAVDGLDPVVPEAEINGRRAPLPGGGVANGVIAPLRIEQMRDRGPRAPRAGPIRGGGPGPPAPPRRGGGGGGGPPIPPVGGPGGGQPPPNVPPGGGLPAGRPPPPPPPVPIPVPVPAPGPRQQVRLPDNVVAGGEPMAEPGT